MTTTRYVNTASSPGGDGTTNATSGANRAYASLNEAEAALPASLSDQWDILCSGTAEDTTKTSFAGTTTTATNFLRIAANTGHEATALWSTSKYRLRVASGFAAFFAPLEIGNQFMRVERLQVSSEPDVSSNGRSVLRGTTNGVYRVTGCLLRFISGGGTGHAGIKALSYDDGNSLAANNVIYATSLTDGTGLSWSSANFTYSGYAYNNTVYNWSTGMQRTGGNAMVAKNNLVQSCTTCYGSTYAAASTNNISEDTSSPNAAFRSLAVTFVNEAGFDFHLDSSDTAAKDAGANLSADATFPISTDIDGETRSGTWDIGADEYVGGGVAAASYLMLLGVG